MDYYCTRPPNRYFFWLPDWKRTNRWSITDRSEWSVIAGKADLLLRRRMQTNSDSTPTKSSSNTDIFHCSRAENETSTSSTGWWWSHRFRIKVPLQSSLLFWKYYNLQKTTRTTLLWSALRFGVRIWPPALLCGVCVFSLRVRVSSGRAGFCSQSVRWMDQDELSIDVRVNGCLSWGRQATSSPGWTRLWPLDSWDRLQLMPATRVGKAGPENRWTDGPVPLPDLNICIE